MRDAESLDLVHGLLLGIRSFAFRLPLHKPELNRWDRETLVLAGLISDIDSRPQFSAPPESMCVLIGFRHFLWKEFSYRIPVYSFSFSVILTASFLCCVLPSCIIFFSILELFWYIFSLFSFVRYSGIFSVTPPKPSDVSRAPVIRDGSTVLDGVFDDLTVIPTRPRSTTNNRRPRSVSSPVVRPAPAALPLPNPVSILAGYSCLSFW